eukprot:TRINITY_DN11479_c0_g2_i6.p1 TRINITY_DN11479_c0_g2~~TRINITY_DN11479_c0_g2_i6.p1  ORF type:complete len:1083 (+),score=198.93 TRINITY_DN11479_c0_g2_i6:56-3304(+)
MDEVQHEPWFAGRMSGVECDRTLLESGCSDGTFMLRESESSPGNCTVAVLYGGQIKNFRIEKLGGMFKLNAKQHFPTLRLLMNTIIADGVRSDGVNIILKPFIINSNGQQPVRLEQAPCEAVVGFPDETSNELAAESNLPPRPAQRPPLKPPLGAPTDYENDDELPPLPLPPRSPGHNQPSGTSMSSLNGSHAFETSTAGAMYGEQVVLQSSTDVDDDDNLYGNADVDQHTPNAAAAAISASSHDQDELYGNSEVERVARHRAPAPLPSTSHTLTAGEDIYDAVRHDSVDSTSNASLVMVFRADTPQLGSSQWPNYFQQHQQPQGQAQSFVDTPTTANRSGPPMVAQEDEYSIVPGVLPKPAPSTPPAPADSLPMAFEEEEYSVLPPPRSPVTPAVVVVQDDDTYDALPPPRSNQPAPALAARAAAPSFQEAAPEQPDSAIYGNDDIDDLEGFDIDAVINQALRDAAAAPIHRAAQLVQEDIYGNSEVDSSFNEPAAMYGNTELHGYNGTQAAAGDDIYGNADLERAATRSEDIYGNDEMLGYEGQALVARAEQHRREHGGPVEAYDVSAGHVGQFNFAPDALAAADQELSDYEEAVDRPSDPSIEVEDDLPVAPDASSPNSSPPRPPRAFKASDQPAPISKPAIHALVERDTAAASLLTTALYFLLLILTILGLALREWLVLGETHIGLVETCSDVCLGQFCTKKCVSTADLPPNADRRKLQTALAFQVINVLLMLLACAWRSVQHLPSLPSILSFFEEPSILVFIILHAAAGGCSLITLSLVGHLQAGCAYFGAAFALMVFVLLAHLVMVAAGLGVTQEAFARVQRRSKRISWSYFPSLTACMNVSTISLFAASIASDEWFNGSDRSYGLKEGHKSCGDLGSKPAMAVQGLAITNIILDAVALAVLSVRMYSTSCNTLETSGIPRLFARHALSINFILNVLAGIFGVCLAIAAAASMNNLIESATPGIGMILAVVAAWLPILNALLWVLVVSKGTRLETGSDLAPRRVTMSDIDKKEGQVMAMHSNPLSPAAKMNLGQTAGESTADPTLQINNPAGETVADNQTGYGQANSDDIYEELPA